VNPVSHFIREGGVEPAPLPVDPSLHPSSRMIFSTKEQAMFTLKSIRTLVRREEGQTLSEYALILVLIAVVAIVAITLLGNQISAVISNIANAL